MKTNQKHSHRPCGRKLVNTKYQRYEALKAELEKKYAQCGSDQQEHYEAELKKIAKQLGI